MYSEFICDERSQVIIVGQNKCPCAMQNVVIRMRNQVRISYKTFIEMWWLLKELQDLCGKNNYF